MLKLHVLHSHLPHKFFKGRLRRGLNCLLFLELSIIAAGLVEERMVCLGQQHFENKVVDAAVVKDIDTWGCEGFAESSAMWALQSWHGFLPLFFFVPFTSGLLLPKLVVEE